MALLESAQMDIGGVKSVDLGPTGQLRGQQTGHSACVCGVWWSIAEKKNRYTEPLVSRDWCKW